MPAQNRFCATTVHADSLPELRSILLGSGVGISPADFARLDLILFMQALPGGGFARWQRRVTEVFSRQLAKRMIPTGASAIGILLPVSSFGREKKMQMLTSVGCDSP